MVYTIKGDGTAKFNPAPASVGEEIIQNVKLLLGSKKYDIPLSRKMGLDASCIGKPLPVAEMLLYQNVADMLEEYEPRAELIDITFESDNEHGVLIPIVEVEIEDG